MIFLSLGAGVSSSVMLMRAIDGDIERPDHVIFADTGAESAQTYLLVRFLEQQCKNAEIPFHRVANEVPLMDAAFRADRWISMPVFVLMPDNSVAMLERQCTSEHKMRPILAKQRELMGYRRGQRIPRATAVVMIGFTTDEAHRCHPAREVWIDRIYPLIDPLKMNRGDCQQWWDSHYPGTILRRSSCFICPYKKDDEWLRMKQEDKEEFERACQLDDALRGSDSKVGGLIGARYLHRSCRPLRTAPLNAEQQTFDLVDNIYCSGGCGL